MIVTLRRITDALKALVLRVDPPYWVLIAALVVLFWPILIGGQVIFWGLPMLQFYPWHWIARQDVLAGYLPLWNATMGMGAPLLANAQSALLYPPNWLLLILPLDLGQGWLMVAYLFLAGAGMVRLSRVLGIGRLGQTVAGLAFMLSGYLVARAWFLSINASVAWLPWIILAGELAWQREKKFFSARLTILLVLQWLAGHWQTAWYTWWLLVGWMFFRALSSRPVLKNLMRSFSLLMSAGLLAFLLGAAQFLPTVEYWLVSQRATGVGLDTAVTYSFWPWRLFGLIAPNFFGNPATGDYWGYANFWEDAIYIGVLPLVLALAAIVQRVRGRLLAGFPYMYCVLLLPVGFIIGMGHWTPVFPFLYQNVPTFNLFSAPTRIMILAVFALALLAAAGADLWLRAQEKEWRRPVLAIVLSLACIVAGTAALRMPAIRDTFGRAIILTGILFTLASGLWIWKVRAQHASTTWRAAVVVLLAVDLCLAARGLVPSAASEIFRGDNPAAAIIYRKLGGRRLYMPEDIRYDLMFGRFFRFVSYQAAGGWMDARRMGLPNLAVLDGISSANNFDSFVPGRAATLLDAIDSLPVPRQEILFRLMDVGAVWQRADAGSEPSLRFLESGAQRAWGVCRARWMLDGNTALQAVIQPEFGPSETVILETGGGEEGAPCRSEPAVTLQMQVDPNAVRADVDFPQDGFFVLADVNYPGWEAFLDGEPVPLLQADYAFRAVRVPAGTHMVEFRYAPISFWGGLLASGCTIFVLLIYWVMRKIRTSRRSPEPALNGELR
jgi:hypothetical protein